MKFNQVYLNIAGSIIAAIAIAAILGMIGWAAKMQVTVNKADLALMGIKNNEEEMMRKNRVYHGRLSKNEKDIKANTKTANRADVQSGINFQLYMKEH